MTPPKMVPCALVSRGSMVTRIAGNLSLILFSVGASILASPYRARASRGRPVFGTPLYLRLRPIRLALRGGLFYGHRPVPHASFQKRIVALFVANCGRVAVTRNDERIVVEDHELLLNGAEY